MKIKILTAFPDFISSIKEFSIIKRAIEKSLLEIEVFDLRKWGIGGYKQIDDTPFGGGAGMLYMIEPIYNALEEIKNKSSYIIATSAKGTMLNYSKSRQLANERELVIVCGHYEGIDYRVHENLVHESISIGDFVLSGGEIPSMVIVDSIVRLLPGVINSESLSEETNEDYLEYPQYTRPSVFKGMKVPDVLLSGDHGKIKQWKDEHKFPNKN